MSTQNVISKDFGDKEAKVRGDEIDGIASEVENANLFIRSAYMSQRTCVNTVWKRCQTEQFAAKGGFRSGSFETVAKRPHNELSLFSA